MDTTITITFDQDTVIVTDGRRTTDSTFSRIKGEDKRALIALAEFFGYEPSELLYFDAPSSDEDDDEILDEDGEMNPDFIDDGDETIEIWLDALLETTGKTSVEELTKEEILYEIDQVKGCIENESIWSSKPGDIHDCNIGTNERYLERLNKMLEAAAAKEA